MKVYEDILHERQSSPSSRLGGAFHQFDTRDMHTTTTYTLFLNVNGEPQKMFVEVRTLCQMER